MIIKTFVGESSAAALKQVRAELGGDAVVLATRRVANTNGGYVTEVTACLDRPKPPTTSASAVSSIPSRRITKPVWNRMVTKSRSTNATTNSTSKTIKSPSDATVDVDMEMLRDLDIPASVIQELIEAAAGSRNIQDALTNQIASRISGVPRFEVGDRVLVVGPSGAGKTSVISKLAAQITAKNLAVTLTGFQQQKIGAVDELQSIADVVGIEYTDDGTVSDTERNAVTLVDCGAPYPSAEDIAAIHPTHTLFIVSATMRGADLSEMGSRFNGLPITGICMTMLDLTHRLGSLFTACDALNAPLALVSTSAFGAESLIAPNAKNLSARMLKEGEKHA